MKHLIDKVEANDVQVEKKIEWLSKSNNNSLWPEGNTELIRCLIKKVVQLEEKIENIEQ